MASADVIANTVVQSFCLGRKEIPPRWEDRLHSILVTILGILITSGVCLMTSGLSHPIFASEGEISKEETIKLQQKESLKIWEEGLIKKYKGIPIYRPADGVAHIKMKKYINGKPIKINVVEINTKVNPNLIVKPETAGEKLNSRAQIRTIANRTDSLVAINAGYFKPTTGVPLGTVMIDNKTLTGPIYNRVGIGISQGEDGTTYSMGRVELNIELKNKKNSIKIDNINQPRMLSTYSLIYTPEWGKLSPLPPKYGANAVIENGKITGVHQQRVEIPQDGYILSAPLKVINEILTLKNLELSITYPEEFQGANHIIGGGPYLIKDGEIFIDVTAEKLGSITGRNPRSAVGYNKDGTLILIAVDGREENSVGMTLSQLASFMKSLGCENAMNFDGGGSSVMYVNGKITNSPAQREGIAISNALTIKVKKV